VNNFIQGLMRGLQMSHNRARNEGNEEKAKGYSMIAIGVVLLFFLPIIGLPLMIWGIIKVNQNA
jgi:hypothetical protein